jgi:hypothetical protein
MSPDAIMFSCSSAPKVRTAIVRWILQHRNRSATTR